MTKTTGSITLPRVQLFINNLPFYCKLPQANGTLIKTKFGLCYFAVWQWQAAHSSAESTQLCSKMWQQAFSCLLAQPTYPASREETGLLLVQEVRTAGVFFKYTNTSTVKIKGTQESTDRSVVWPQLLALYSQVTEYSGPVSQVWYAPSRKFHTSLQYSCYKPLLELYCFQFWMLDETQELFPFRRKKGLPYAWKSCPAACKSHIKMLSTCNNGIVLHLWLFKQYWRSKTPNLGWKQEGKKDRFFFFVSITALLFALLLGLQCYRRNILHQIKFNSENIHLLYFL